MDSNLSSPRHAEQSNANNAAPRFDLVDIVQTLSLRRRFIVLVTTLAVIIGALAYFLSAKKYKATAEVFISNPVYSDRAYIFPTVGVPTIDYFGGEDMIDKAMVIGSSESTREEVARRMDLARIYKIDTSTRQGRGKLIRAVADALVLKRTEYGNFTLSYTDEDPARAAEVANTAVQVLEDTYHRFYSSKRGQVVAALRQKSAEADSAIEVLTDTLAAMRDRYGIYEILSPNRGTTVQTTNTGVRNGRAIEEVQNIESLKDQWVIDRARCLAIINEMSTGIAAGQTPILFVQSPATPPSRAAGLGLVLSVAAWGLAGVLAASLWVLLSTYTRKLIRVQRSEA